MKKTLYTQSEHEIVYVAGIDLHNAQERYENNPSYGFDTPGAAYDDLSYYDTVDHSWDVFKFEVRTDISKVEPPYER